MSSIPKISQNAVKISTNQIFRKTMEKFQLEYYKKIAIITKGNGFNENTTNGNNNRTFILLGTYTDDGGYIQWIQYCQVLYLRV